jgi:hypothetical protein
VDRDRDHPAGGACRQVGYGFLSGEQDEALVFSLRRTLPFSDLTQKQQSSQPTRIV